MTNIVMAFAISAFVAWYYIPRVIKIDARRHLTDHPGPRKVHNREVPTLGGIGIFGGFGLGFLLNLNGTVKGAAYFMAALIILFFIGLNDDLTSVKPRKKIAAEACVALILIFFTDIRFTSFHGFLGINEIPLWITCAVTIFLMIVIINSMNLIDGIDGLAASIGIISTVTFGVWFWMSGDIGYTVMAAALSGALVVFLCFNISKGKYKIFMGDTGSLVIGFILSVMTIRFNEINVAINTFPHLHSAPAVSIGILIVPLFDTLRVFTVRVMHGNSPFVADDRHIHHMMLRAGFSHRQSTFWITLAHTCIIAMSFTLDGIGILWLSLVLLLVCSALTCLVYALMYRNSLRKHIIVSSEDMNVIKRLPFIHKAM